LLAHIEEFATGLVGVIPPQVPVLEALGHIPARRADIVPGGKVLAGRTQHDDLDLVIIDCAAKTIVQRVGHLRVLYVVVLRAAHGDDRHAVLHPVGHRVVGLVDRRVLTLDEFAHPRTSSAVRMPAGLPLSWRARRLCGSSRAMIASCSAVGCGVSPRLSTLSSGKPVRSCTSSKSTPGCSDSTRAA